MLNDKKAYYDDVSLSSLNVLELFNKDTGGYDSVDCILTNRPKSFLWKYWVRGDKQNSQFNKGFPITCAHYRVNMSWYINREVFKYSFNKLREKAHENRELISYA